VTHFRRFVAWRLAVPASLAVLGIQWATQAQPADFARPGSGPGGEVQLPRAAALIDDVEGAFARIEVCGEHLTARTNGLIPKPRYRTSVRNLFGLLNHFQGIQRLPGSHHVAISGSGRSASPAELFIVRLGEAGRPGEVVTRLGLDPVMHHAGGLSLEGTILAVPLHGGTPRMAKVVFYDVADPERPRKLDVEIDRPGRKAGAVALTRLASGRFLAAVLSAYDGLPRRMDFYLSRGTALEDGFLAEPATWRVAEVEARPSQDRTFSHFQSINFIRQSDDRLYLAGFHNSVASPSILPGRDYADLYEVIFPSDTIDALSPRIAKPSIIKAANRLLRCTGGYCNLDAAAGLFVDPETRSLSVYAAPGWVDGDTVKVTVYRSR
jgi:hypothetical protein